MRASTTKANARDGRVRRRGGKQDLAVLFTCIGRRVSLLEAFREAARRLRLGVRFCGTDVTALAPALHRCDKAFLVEPTTHPRYIAHLLSIVQDHGVRLVVPTTDLDLQVLARHRPRFERLGCRVLVSDHDVISVCRDKRQTSRFLRRHGFDGPRTLSVRSALAADLLGAARRCLPEAMEGPVVLAIQDASGEPYRVAYAGEVMATTAMRLGAIGMVTDGALRDVNEVHALGFHYFMQYPVVSHANFEITSVGEPIVLDGQEVRTGDILHGDGNGIVIVPDEVLEGLPEAVATIQKREAETMAFIRGNDFDYAQLRKRSGY